MYHSQLRAFHAVAVHGGFSKAAAKLNLTQPAISDQVRKLEDRFDVLLFDRRRRAVRPTDLGLRLLEITRRMFEMEGEAVELLTESQVLRTGHLNIAADGPIYVVRLIGAFRKAFPGISISLRICNSGDVLQRLVDYDADIGVLAEVPADTRLKTMQLSQDPVIAFVGREHPWAHRTSARITMAELAGSPLVMREEGSLTRLLIEEEAARFGARLDMVMVANSREAIREAVVAGIGVGVLTLPEFGDDDRLVPLTISDCRRRLTESVVCLAERAHLRLVDVFWTETARQIAAWQRG
jgi:aminoethylphosphonate catabolism LysR family transcriptional regulator